MIWFCGSRTRLRRRSGISFTFTGSLPRNTRCCLSMEMTRRSCVISFTVFVFGTLTSMPDCNMGAVTMKMMSSTKTTSTKGVTLMSDMARLPRCPPPVITPIAISAALHGVEQFEREIVHARAELADLIVQQVIEDHRRDRGEQAGCSGDQRLRNARRYRTQGR